MTAASPFAPASQADLPALARLISLAYAAPRDKAEEYLRLSGLEHVRAFRDHAAAPSACLLRIPMGQWFGGRSVPMTGIAAVAVAPEARGRGCALALMQHALREIAAEGVPLSGLYASTQTLYRQVGYEQGGHCFRLRLPLAQISVRDRDLPIRPLTDADEPAVRAGYNAFARQFDGMLDRGPYVWTRTRKWRDAAFEGWGVIGPSGEIEGHVHLAQERNLQTGHFNLTVSDLAFATPRAGRRLLGFLADFATTGDEAILQTGPIHPLLALLPTQKYALERREYWMTRITCLPAAFEARGFPRALSARLALDVTDELIPDNHAAFTLHIDSGQPRVVRGASGPASAVLRLDIRALAPLYTGLWSARQAVLAGLIQGDESALDAAQAIFPGAAPWMADFF